MRGGREVGGDGEAEGVGEVGKTLFRTVGWVKAVSSLAIYRNMAIGEPTIEKIEGTQRASPIGAKAAVLTRSSNLGWTFGNLDKMTYRLG